MGFENAFDEIGNLLLLEDSAISGPTQKPKPRHDDGAIENHSTLIADLEKATDEAVEKPGFAIRHGKPNRGVGAHNLLELDIRALAPQMNLHFEQTTQLLPNRKRFDQQNIGPK